MATEETHTTDPEFGRLVYAKDLSYTLARMIERGLFAGSVAAFGVLLLVFGIKDSALAPILLGLLAMLLAPAAWYFLVYLVRRNRFQFFEQGFVQTTVGGQCRLAYADIASFTYNVSRVYVNFLYSHTDALMQFQFTSGPPIVYHTQDVDSGDQLSGVLHCVSEVVGARLVQTLSAGGAVDWCGGSRFLPEGVELMIPAMFGREKQTFVPYDRLARAVIDTGRCRLYEVDNDRPLVEKQVLLPNFFPGLVLLNRLTEGRLKTD